MSFGELTTTTSTCCFQSFRGHFGASHIISHHPPISDMVCKTYPPVPFLVTGASPQLKHRHFAKFKAPLETLGLGDLPGRLPPSKNRKWERRPLLITNSSGGMLRDKMLRFWWISPQRVRLFPKFFCSCQAFLQKRYGNLIRAWRQALSQTDSMVSRTGFLRCACRVTMAKGYHCWPEVLSKLHFLKARKGRFGRVFLETHRMIWVFFSWSIKKCWFNHTIDPNTSATTGSCALGLCKGVQGALESLGQRWQRCGCSVDVVFGSKRILWLYSRH